MRLLQKWIIYVSWSSYMLVRNFLAMTIADQHRTCPYGNALPFTPPPGDPDRLGSGSQAHPAYYGIRLEWSMSYKVLFRTRAKFQAAKRVSVPTAPPGHALTIASEISQKT